MGFFSAACPVSEDDVREVLDLLCGFASVDRSSIVLEFRLIATTAHELGHARLLGEERITADRRDHEPLTDLLTVYLGLGVFTSNAAFDYRQDHRQRTTQRLGYLTEPMFGYGLACHAWLRGEPRPAWARHLDTNPRVVMRSGLRYLARVAPPREMPGG